MMGFTAVGVLVVEAVLKDSMYSLVCECLMHDVHGSSGSVVAHLASPAMTLEFHQPGSPGQFSLEVSIMLGVRVYVFAHVDRLLLIPTTRYYYT